MAIKNVRCESYRPGHNVHWIQAREKAHTPRVWANVVATMKEDVIWSFENPKICFAKAQQL